MVECSAVFEKKSNVGGWKTVYLRPHMKYRSQPRFFLTSESVQTHGSPGISLLSHTLSGIERMNDLLRMI